MIESTQTSYQCYLFRFFAFSLNRFLVRCQMSRMLNSLRKTFSIVVFNFKHLLFSDTMTKKQVGVGICLNQTAKVDFQLENSV